MSPSTSFEDLYLKVSTNVTVIDFVKQNHFTANFNSRLSHFNKDHGQILLLCVLNRLLSFIIYAY